jgi:hypothetical protein
MEQVNKISDSSFEIVKEPVLADPVIETYSIDELKGRELSITKEINDFVTEKKKELEIVKGLIEKAEDLGLKTSDVIREEQLALEEAELEEIKPLEEVLITK